MNPGGSDSNPSAQDTSTLQKAFVAQLSQAIMAMHHIDELLQWLAYAITRRFNIQLIQCWTNQINQTGQLAPHLRTIMRMDNSLPQQVVVNEAMTSIAQRMLSERRFYLPQAVETLFPSYQAILLKRYGLYYCGSCFSSRSALIMPPGRATLDGGRELEEKSIHK